VNDANAPCSCISLNVSVAVRVSWLFKSCKETKTCLPDAFWTRCFLISDLTKC